MEVPSFEEFCKKMKEDDISAKRKYYEWLLFGMKERLRYREKAKKQYQRRKEQEEKLNQRIDGSRETLYLQEHQAFEKDPAEVLYGC